MCVPVHLHSDLSGIEDSRGFSILHLFLAVMTYILLSRSDLKYLYLYAN